MLLFGVRGVIATLFAIHDRYNEHFLPVLMFVDLRDAEPQISHARTLSYIIGYALVYGKASPQIIDHDVSYAVADQTRFST